MELKSTRDIPLFTALTRLYTDVDELVATMQRKRQYTTGVEMLHRILEMVDCLSFAIDFPEFRRYYLVSFLSKYNELAMLMKVSNDKKWVLQKRYLQLSPNFANIEKQAKGWLAKTSRIQPEQEELNTLPGEHPLRGGHTLPAERTS